MDVEQFEPILSDEEIVDEVDPLQFQDMDYDFNEEEEVCKMFNPFTCEFQPMVVLSDPSEAECEAEWLGGTARGGEEAARLLELMERRTGEDWVHAVEQAPALLTKALPSLMVEHPEVLSTLISWVNVGLDFSAAVEQPQPGYKVRHLKAGVRLTEALCQCGECFTVRLLDQADIHNKLLQLYSREYMALSIKLMILKALDASLSWKSSVDRFLGLENTSPVKLEHQVDDVKRIFSDGVKRPETVNGYRTLVDLALEPQLARVKFALASLLRKLHAYEALGELRERAGRVAQDIAPTEQDVEAMAACLEQVATSYREAAVLMAQPRRYLPVARQFDTGVDSCDPRPALHSYFRAHRLLECLLVLLTSPHTLHRSALTGGAQAVLSALLARDSGQRFLLARAGTTTAAARALMGDAPDEMACVAPSQRLGLKLAYSMQALQLVDLLLLEDSDNATLSDTLHALYCLGHSSAGKLALSTVIGAGDNVAPLLRLFARPVPPPARAYAADLVLNAVKLCDSASFALAHARDVARAAATPDGGRLREAAAWLAPLGNRVTYDSLAPLLDTVARGEEAAAQLPGELITALRVLKQWGVEEEDRQPDLRQRYVILQMYAADGTAQLCAILNKVCAHYEQPALHGAHLAGMHGAQLAALVLPAAQLLRSLLAQAVAARAGGHRDLTAVPALLATHALMQAFPAGAMAGDLAARACAACVDALLAFTQCAAEPEQLHKSAWTTAAAQVVKHVTSGPQHLVPGLVLLSEMLPLPLPVHARTEPPEADRAQAVSARRLWSAHLHPLAPAISDLVSSLSSSSCAPLLHLLRRVCAQLSDLAAPTALAVARALLDPLLSADDARAARSLGFAACMAAHAPVKACLALLLSGGAGGKQDDARYATAAVKMCAVLTRVSDTPAHAQAQECVIGVMQCLCDVETSLAAPEVVLHNALPGADLLVAMTTALLEHLANPDQGATTLLPAARTLLVLAEHDFTLYHLRAAAMRCVPAPLRALFNKLCAAFTPTNNTQHCALATSLEFLRTCLSCEGLEARTLAISMPELAVMLDYRLGEEHPVTQLEQLLQECSGDEDGLESLLENVACLARLLEEEAGKPIEAKEWVEPVLPPPDALLAQFSARPVFQLGEVEEERLSSSYWLAPPPSDDLDQDMDQVVCDLLELCRELLPELQLAAQAEQLCRVKTGVCSADNDDADVKKRGDAADARSKRPFVAPMRGRGFGRGAPQRGDLFRSRPPNTSRPPSLHVDDFVALESSGQQPTGPTGYNKLAMRAAKDMIGGRGRGRGRAFPVERGRFFPPLPTTYRRENGCNGAQAWSEDARSFPARRGLRPPAWPLKEHRERFVGPSGRGLARREAVRHARTFTR